MRNIRIADRSDWVRDSPTVPARPVRHFSDLYAADSEAREVARGVAA